jgi:hypothetical protein
MQYRQNEALRAFGRGRGNFGRKIAKPRITSESCWRCLSAYHKATNCFHVDKVCRNCNRRGHIARACTTQAKQESFIQRKMKEESEPSNKIAAIQEKEFEEQTEVNEIDML